MNSRTQKAFLALIVAQAAHSVEEYSFALYEVFPPARFVSSLLSSDLGTGFAVVNGLIVAFGAWCYLYPVRSRWTSARVLAWLWVAIELANGAGHLVLALQARGYFPGAVTAPILLLLAIGLAAQLLRDRGSRSTALTA